MMVVSCLFVLWVCFVSNVNINLVISGNTYMFAGGKEFGFEGINKRLNLIGTEALPMMESGVANFDGKGQLHCNC
jgi:hypothetical protein